MQNCEYFKSQGFEKILTGTSSGPSYKPYWKDRGQYQKIDLNPFKNSAPTHAINVETSLNPITAAQEYIMNISE